jgi:hypothetical protein
MSSRRRPRECDLTSYAWWPLTLARTISDLIRWCVPLDDVDRPGTTGFYDQHRRVFRKRGVGPGQIGLRPTTDPDQRFPWAGKPAGTDGKDAEATYTGLVPNHGHPSRRAVKSIFLTLSGPDHDPSGRIQRVTSAQETPSSARPCRARRSLTDTCDPAVLQRRLAVRGSHGRFEDNPRSSHAESERFGEIAKMLSAEEIRTLVLDSTRHHADFLARQLTTAVQTLRSLPHQ